MHQFATLSTFRAQWLAGAVRSQSMYELRTERMATGGEAVARLDDGRVVFVRGALPHETVQVQLTEQKKRFARGVVHQVVESSPDRVEPSCEHGSNGDCGGCDWMHIAPVQQLELKRQIVVEQLERLGGIEAAVVTSAAMQRGHRTTVRCSVLDGRAGYRRRRSNAVFEAQSCSAAHPLIEELIVDGRFGDATQATIRVGAATGDRLVLTNGDPRTVTVPGGVEVVSAADPGPAAIHEEVAGRRWRISANSFFQTSDTGAEALVSAVADAVQISDGSVVDLYGGVGLLGGGAAPERLMCSVESNPSSSRDAGHNLGGDVDVVHSRVERWQPSAFDTVIADPARRGLGREGVAAVDATAATTLALVSCDPAALGRDVGLLTEQGWRYNHGVVIDMFPDTSRIEVVSTLQR